MREPVLPPNVPKTLDQELLAWAAGFFDGEGSTIARGHSRRPNYRQLQVSVPQSSHDGTVPEVLSRFQVAALGMGRIEAPNSDDVRQWRSRGRIDGEVTLALLWPHLGSVKRAQASAALDLVEHQYESMRRRPPRFMPQFVPHAHLSSGEPARIGRAWAAGFLDAEGWFGVVRGQKRKDGSTIWRIRVSAPQHSGDGSYPAVLIKMQQLLGGRIETHGEPDDFKWVVTGRDRVAEVLEAVRPWLGLVKRDQAERALAFISAQPRVRGGGMTCVRGHTYDAVVTRPSGRVVKVCLKCNRLRDRATRLARGGTNRFVRSRSDDPTRVYRVKVQKRQSTK